MSRPSTLIGLTCVTLSLILLGYYVYQTQVTDFVSQRRHHDIADRLRAAWEDPQVVEAGGTIDTDFGEAYAILRIPRLGDDYAVPLIRGIDDTALASGVGVFDTSAEPGAEGNLTLAGHRVTHGEPFRDLPELEPGDEVVVETAAAIHTYVLDTPGDALEVDFTQGWVVDQQPVNPDPNGVGPTDEPSLITLTTCSELFHTDNRLAVFGHLVETVQRN